MSDVEERILGMKFDNKQFESGIQTTMSSLDKFNNKLKLDGATKGLTDVDKAAKNLSFAGLVSGVENISNKFTALGIVGITILQNIANAAVNAGSKLVSALTIDPIKTGLQEYETQLNAVQTIMANTSAKGTTLKDVNAALAELNTYADKTVYNFTEMTRNIGTFTAAGVDLETSTGAIKGIANLAAVSGSNAQQASTAMYQLSQALASGTVKLQDWNSVVNAGMGGQVFQDALKETARLHGVKIDDMIKKEGSFRETLQNGWLTSKILTETLAKFTGDLSAEQLKSMGYSEQQIADIIKLGQMSNDAATKVKTFTQLLDTLSEAVQSGWAQSWQIVLGDFEEAKTLFTSMSNVLGNMIGDYSDARNQLLQGWADLGGRKALIDGFANAFDALLIVVKPLGQAFSEIFPPLTAKNLYDATVVFKNFTESLKMGETNVENLKRTFKGIFAIFSMIGQAISPLIGYFLKLTGQISPAGNSLLSLTARLGDFLVRMDAMFKRENTFIKFFKNIETGIRNFANGFEFLRNINISGVFSTIKDAIKGVVDLVVNGKFTKELAQAFNIDENNPIVGFILDARDALMEFVGLLAKLKVRFEPLKALGNIVAQAFGHIWSALKTTAPVFVWFANIVSPILRKIQDNITNFMQSLNFKALSDGFNVGLIAMIAISIKRFIDSMTDIGKGGKGIIDGIKGILDGVTGSLEAMQSNLKSKTLLNIAAAIAIMTASILVLSTIDSDKLTTALTAITIMFLELSHSMTSFSKLPVGGMAQASIGMIAMSASILILALAMKKLEDLDIANTTKGVLALAALMGFMVKASEGMQGNTKGLIAAGAGLIIFGAAIHVLAGAVRKLGELDTETLIKGLVSVGVLIAEIALFLKVSDLDGMGLKSGVGLILLATSLKIMASAVGDFAKMDEKSLTKGLLSIAGVLAAVGAFSNMTSGNTNVMSSAVALTVISAAMLIFSKVVRDLGSMSVETLSKGLLTMAGSLLAVTMALNSMPPTALGSGAAMVLVGAALLMITNVLERLGNMSVEQLVKGLLTLAGALVVIAAATNAMTGALPGAAAILVVSAALLLLLPVLQAFAAMSWEGIAKGLVMLAGVFVIFGAAAYILAPLVPVMIGLGLAIALLGVGLAAAGIGVLAFAAGIMLLGVAFAVAGTSIVLGVTAILGLIPVALTQLGLGIIAFAGVIAQGAPAIMAAMVAVLVSIITAISIVAPLIISTLVNLVMMLVDVLVQNVPKLVDSGMKLLLGILKGIRDNIKDIVKVGIDIVTEFIGAISNKLPAIIQAGVELILSFIEGLTQAVRNNSERMGAAGGDLAVAMIDGLVRGLGAGISRVATAAANVAKSAFQAAMDAVAAKSPSKDFHNLGMWMDQGLEGGIIKYGDSVSDAAAEVSRSALNVMKDTLSDISRYTGANMDLDPVIRPVIDVSGIDEGLIDIKNMSKPYLDISGNYNAARSAYTQSPEPNVSSTKPTSGNMSFVQNNYSPKSLSELEIYRNTHNQLRAFKEVIRNT